MEICKIMDFELYSSMAMNTANENLSWNESLSMGALGLSGESGELCDAIKKHLYHGHTLDLIEAEKELGDVLWYVNYLAVSLGLDLEEIAAKNIDKLKKRYPNKFSNEASQNRVDVTQDIKDWMSIKPDFKYQNWVDDMNTGHNV